MLMLYYLKSGIFPSLVVHLLSGTSPVEIAIEITKVHKVVPLRTSGEEEAFANLAILKISQDGIDGYGEVVPFSFHRIDNSWDVLAKWLPRLSNFKDFSPLERSKIEEKLIEVEAPMAIRAGVDMALYDWLGKTVSLPLYDILGFGAQTFPDTSLTIGISSPEKAVERLQSWTNLGPTRLWKIKLGSPKSLDADKAMFEVLAQKIAPTGAKIYVDANGGWTLDQAFEMANWLKAYDVLFVEQPLARGKEKELAELSDNSPLSIFADESCLHSRDMRELVSGARAGCHGVNIKISKCGGISEALRMIVLARHHKLKVMLGCFSNTILGNTAAAHISSLVDYVDLDSHLNLKDDPFTGGAVWSDGKIIPNNQPGLGVEKVT